MEILRAIAIAKSRDPEVGADLEANIIFDDEAETFLYTGSMDPELLQIVLSD